MSLAFSTVTQTLRAVCYLTLFMDISARMMFWFGAENTATGSLLRSVSEFISYPFRRVLRRAVERHPSLEMLPGLIATALVFIIAESIP